MKHLSYVVVLVGSLFLASCAMNRTVSYTTSLGTQNYIIDVTPMIATLQVEDTHVEGTFSWEGKKRATADLGELKDNAVFNALKKRQADVLVAPQYQISIEIRGNRKFINVTVIGYPAKYVSFVPAPKDDSIEVRELKDDSNYVIVTKDSNGAATRYQVVLPYDKERKTLDLDDATVEKVILDGNNAKIGRPKKTPKVTEPAEQKGVMEKIADKMTGKGKKARKG